MVRAPRNVQSAFRSLAAPHRQNDGARLDREDAERAIHRGYGLIGGKGDDGGLGEIGNVQPCDLFFMPPCVLGSRQLLAEAVKPEAVVNTLGQDTAEFLFPLENQKITDAGAVCRDRRRHAGGSSADNDKVLFHPFFLSVRVIWCVRHSGGRHRPIS